jgi:hypothetical protein
MKLLKKIINAALICLLLIFGTLYLQIQRFSEINNIILNENRNLTYKIDKLTGKLFTTI